MYTVAADTFLRSLVVVALSAGDAMAYIDPGTGSLLLQMIIAGVIGGLFHFRRYLTSLISYLRNGRQRGDGKPDD